MKLAYADPPYPGKAHLYVEQTEVDHSELVERLTEYDGWALSTDEINLAYLLGLCPPRTRVLAWCRKNTNPLYPFPIAAWEPVLMHPARTNVEPVFSYLVSPVMAGALVDKSGEVGRMTGQKPQVFCEWVIRCLGAEQGDTLDDLYPGTEIMSKTWQAWNAQTRIRLDASARPYGVTWHNRVGRSNQALDGIEQSQSQPERRVQK